MNEFNNDDFDKEEVKMLKRVVEKFGDIIEEMYGSKKG